MPRPRKAAEQSAADIALPETPEPDAAALPDSQHAFDTQQWRVAALTQAALLRRLEDDGKEGQPRMVAAELSAALALLKLLPPRAPDAVSGTNPFDSYADEDDAE